MTIEQLEAVNVMSVAQGKALAAAILAEQKDIHRQMQGLYDNARWQELSDRHFYLRKARHRILHVGTATVICRMGKCLMLYLGKSSLLGRDGIF